MWTLDASVNHALVHQYRYLYPSGDGAACCIDRRSVVCVRGAIRNPRQLAEVARILRYIDGEGYVQKAVRS